MKIQYREREAIAAIKEAELHLANAIKLSKQIEYGSEVLHPLATAQKEVAYALGIAQDGRELW